MPVGSILRCRDTSVQDMIVTKSFDLAIYPFYNPGYLIYAMCGEISDAGPGRNKFYDYAGFAEPEVVKIANLIETKNIQDRLGQFTMWAVRNDADSTKLIHYGATQKDLQLVVKHINEAGLTTVLTEQISTTKNEIRPEIKEPTNKKVEETTDEFKVNTLTWILFELCGVLVILLVFFKIKKNKNIT